MDSQLIARLERIAALKINLLPLPEITTHFVFEREGFVVLVERRGEGFGGVGSPGQLSESGFAALVDRQGTDWFVGKQTERAASKEDAEEARRLFTDLKSILSQSFD